METKKVEANVVTYTAALSRVKVAKCALPESRTALPCFSEVTARYYELLQPCC